MVNESEYMVIMQISIMVKVQKYYEYKIKIVPIRWDEIGVPPSNIKILIMIDSEKYREGKYIK